MSAANSAARPASAGAPEPAGALPTTRRLSGPTSRAGWLAIAVTAATFLLAFKGGFYQPQDREALTVVVWWAIALGAILGFWPRAPVPRSALVAGGLLAAFALWTGLSALWAPAPETALAELGRVLLYLGIFLLALLATRPGDGGRIADGLGLGIAAVAALALASRLFPDLVGTTELDRLLPGATDRLTYPVDYWNGLGILLGLGFALLLRTAATEGARWRRLAIAPVPMLSCAIYLTSSRGGVLVAATGMVVLVALTDRRVLTAVAAGLGLGASVLAIAVLRARDAVVSGPFESDLASSQGRSAALLIVLISLLTGVLMLFVAALAPVRPRMAPALRGAGVAAAVVAGLVALALLHPGQRFEEFRAPPASGDVSIESHLFSAGGSGRWQFWDGALDQFAAHPLAGGGAGSYESWWAVNGSIPYFLRDAHSVWLETAGELGLLGIALLVAFVASALVGGALALRRGPPEERATPAALMAVVIAFCAGAAVDWMWEMTVVAAIAVLCAGLLAGPAVRRRAAEPTLDPADASEGARTAGATAPRPRRLAFAPRVVLVEVALTAVALVALPLLSERGLDQSRADAERGYLAAATESALDARALAPWTSGPPQQLALVRESAGDLAGASVWVDRAIEENDADWRLWLLAARIQTASGQAERARESLRRAKALNPKSEIFASSP